MCYGLLCIRDIQLHCNSENGRSATQAPKLYTNKPIKIFSRWMALKSGRWTTLDHVTMLPNVNRGHRRAAVCTLDRCSVLIAKQHLHLTSQLEMLKLSVIYVPPMWPQAARLLRSPWPGSGKEAGLLHSHISGINRKLEWQLKPFDYCSLLSVSLLSKRNRIDWTVLLHRSTNAVFQKFGSCTWHALLSLST